MQSSELSGSYNWNMHAVEFNSITFKILLN